MILTHNKINKQTLQKSQTSVKTSEDRVKSRETICNVISLTEKYIVLTYNLQILIWCLIIQLLLYKGIYQFRIQGVSLLTSFDNFNFLKAFFSKMMSNI